MKIDVRSDGAVTLTVNNQVLVRDLFAYLPIAGRFGFGSRTGTEGGLYAIDDLRITTSGQGGAYVVSAEPTGPGASPSSVVVIRLQDFSAEVDPTTVSMLLNNAPVTATATKDSGLTTVIYDSPADFATGSENAVQLTYVASGVTNTARYTFTIAAVKTLPSTIAHATADTNAPGFRLRVVQASATPTLLNTIQRAEAQLAGTLTNEATGQPYENEANLEAAGPSGFIQEDAVINYADSGTPGRFGNDRSIPGIPGATGHRNNFATEIITWLYLPAGGHRFGISSDEGFELRAGINARDVTSTVLGSFDGSRSDSETVIDFVVQQAGYYSFRLLWFQGEGPASLEWYSIDLTSGQRVLINDLSNPNAIRAYRSGPNLPYLSFASPSPGATAETNASVRLILVNGDSPVATNTLELRLNNQVVNAQISSAGTNSTSISFTPTTPFGGGVAQNVTLTYTAGNQTLSKHYSFAVRSSEAPRLNIAILVNGQVSVTWQGGGTLEATPDLKVAGTVWTPVTEASGGSYLTQPTGSRMFFRVRR